MAISGENLKLGVIGIGKMGGIIVRSVVNNLLSPQQISIVDLDQELVSQLCNDTGVTAVSNIQELVNTSDYILCAVPPIGIPHILPQISQCITEKQWLISIAAGVSTPTLEAYFTSPPPIVRVMPNIAASVGAAVSVLSRGVAANEEHLSQAQKIFDCCGITLIMEEHHINAVTGVSGSGPAYVALFIEALADAGVQVGLSRKDAQTLAIHTVFGTASIMKESNEHPANLKNRVTTPGGTTAAGLHALEKGGLRSTIADAILSATKRAKELDSSN
ncbi:pyrroline-5-carboxylate reductase [Candidatus Poribacteria bacterium]|nr:pyrroline-5-carboxylate reductase [Candidatus Poribacteria bacterium]